MAKTIYLDTEFMCHTENDGTFELLTTVETNRFDNYCKEYIECHRLIPKGYSWTRDDGTVFTGGEMIFPCKDYKDLLIIQHNADKKTLSIYKEALTTVGITVNT